MTTGARPLMPGSVTARALYAILSGGARLVRVNGAEFEAEPNLIADLCAHMGRFPLCIRLWWCDGDAVSDPGAGWDDTLADPSDLPTVNLIDATTPIADPRIAERVPGTPTVYVGDSVPHRYLGRTLARLDSIGGQQLIESVPLDIVLAGARTRDELLLDDDR